MSEFFLAERVPCLTLITTVEGREPYCSVFSGTFETPPACDGCKRNGYRVVVTNVVLEPARECFVYMGEDTYIDGVPFGAEQKHGDEYRMPSGPMKEGDVRMWREVES